MTAIQNDLETQKAQKLLKRYFQSLRKPTWQKVADHFHLPNRTQAWMMAMGKLKCTDEMRKALHVERLRGTKKLKRLVNKIAVPFLQKRRVSKARVYGRGGVPL